MPIKLIHCPICHMISEDRLIDSRGGICLLEWDGQLMAVSRIHTTLDLVGAYPIVSELFGFDFKDSVDRIFVGVEEVSGHGGVTLIQIIFE